MILKIPGTHPALAGHFPGSPVVPGVVIMDEVIAAIEEMKGKGISVKSISAIKFLNPVGSDEEFEISLTEEDPGKVSFSVHSDEKEFLKGSLVCS